MAGLTGAQRAFLAPTGWADAEAAALVPDASFRTYTRLWQGGESRLLMTAPPEREKLPEYLKMTAHLTRLGVRAPKVFASDTATGFALIEDFGDDTFTRLLARGLDDLPLYRLAAQVMRTIHGHTDACAVELPPYDMATLLREAEIFTDWFVPALRGSAVTDAERAQYRAAWADALATVAEDRSCLVMRDFHVDNLMIVGDGMALSNCGLLDYQDALIGSPAYDLVSLVEDARRDVSPEARAAVLELYFEGRDAAFRAGVERDMAILGAQRHAKVAGIFVRLLVRDGKDVYLKHVPRVLRLLEACLEAPALSGVKAMIESLVPDYRNLPIRRP